MFQNKQEIINFLLLTLNLFARPKPETGHEKPPVPRVTGPWLDNVNQEVFTVWLMFFLFHDLIMT